MMASTEVCVDALIFHANGLVLEGVGIELDIFHVSLGPEVGFLRFSRVHGSAGTFLSQGWLPAHAPVPSPLVSVPGVLWRRQAAIEADRAIASFRQAGDPIDGSSLPPTP